MPHSDRPGPDGETSRDRRTRDLRKDRKPVRHLLAADVGGAHLGLALTIGALLVAAGFSGPRWVLLATGACATWFTLALLVVHLRGARGRNAVRRAYVATFGWGDYVTP
ncbi:hypothetical protein [Streptomyces clavifer]|uniref:hypothetical protein n=1 Tax=Streptomyces clavifer TaxID=68188 RepID=UPI0030876847|nr:hypothetical protein OG388_30675 [Streptomyces clavifer]